MRLRIRPTTLQGQPLKGEGEVFGGDTATDVVNAMQRAQDGGAYRPLDHYIEEVASRVRQLVGVELEVAGDTPEERATSLLDALIKRGLAEELADGPAPIPLTAVVWQGIEAVRRSGLTNMLDRPMVVRLARELDYFEAADWVEGHHREYAEGVFHGFIVQELEDKP